MKIGGVLVSIQQNECWDKNNIKKTILKHLKELIETLKKTARNILNRTVFSLFKTLMD